MISKEYIELCVSTFYFVQLSSFIFTTGCRLYQAFSEQELSAPIAAQGLLTSSARRGEVFLRASVQSEGLARYGAGFVEKRRISWNPMLQASWGKGAEGLLSKGPICSQIYEI